LVEPAFLGYGGDALIAVRFSMLVASLLCAASVAAAATDWHVIGHGSATGSFAVAEAMGSVKHPHGIAVRVTGGGSSVAGTTGLACLRGSSKIAPDSGAPFKGHFAALKLPMKNPDICEVTASASGHGHLVLQILAR
jgi:hypothetical protein